MRRFAALLASFSVAIVAAQVPNVPAQLAASAVRWPVITAITSGNTLGVMDYGFSAGTVPNQSNRLYTDDSTVHWQVGAFDDIFLGKQQILTQQADGDTTGNGTVVSFTTDSPITLCIIHADSVTSKPTWLTGTYVDKGDNASMDEGGEPGSFYCASVAAAATPAAPTTINLGGNCLSSCPFDAMYVPVIVPFWLGTNIPSFTPGSIGFAPASYTQAEQTVVTFSVERTGGVAGACSATVAEGANPSNGVLNTTSVSWVDGEGGFKTGTVTLADVAADASMTIVLSGFTGCANGNVATATLNITASVPSGTNGTYSYAGQQSVSENESTTFQRGVTTRLVGSTGAVAVRMYDTLSGTCTSATHYNAISPIDVEFATGVSGQDDEVFSITALSVAADCTIILGYQAPITGGWTLGATNQTKIITILNTGGGPPSSAQTYYISTSGSDSNDGLTTGTAWRNLARADGVTASADGDVLINVGPGTYTAFGHVQPTAGGTDTTHRKRYCPNGGDVTLLGTGFPQYSVTLNAGINWIDFGCGCSVAADRFTIDGQWTPVKNGDSTGGNTQQGMWVAGTDICLDYDHNNIGTIGYAGIDIDDAAANRITMRPNMDVVGTPYWTSDDTGNSLYIFRTIPSTSRFLVDGGTTGRTLKHGGHAIFQNEGGSVTLRGLVFSNTWNDLASYSAGPPPDGNRAGVLGVRNALNSYMHDIITNRVGKPGDSPDSEEWKCEGTNSGISDSIFRNTHYMFIVASAAEWSDYARGCHISHSVFENGGVLFYYEDWCGASGGAAAFTGYKIKNIISRNLGSVASAYGSYYDNVIGTIRGNGGCAGVDISQFEIDGWTIQDATRNASQLYFIINNSKLSVTQAMATYPNSFKNITVTTDANLDNAPAAGTDVTLAGYVSQYTPVSDSLSIDQGSNLTQANGAGSSSTALVVDDACWFPDPVWGTPGIGQSTGGYQVHIAGVGNRTITAKTIPSPTSSCAGTLTITPASSWADNAAVNLRIASGSTPDRGITH